jgi:hypothetical protein
MARATTNLAPGITFAIAAVIGYSSPHVSIVAVIGPSDFLACF